MLTANKVVKNNWYHSLYNNNIIKNHIRNLKNEKIKENIKDVIHKIKDKQCRNGILEKNTIKNIIVNNIWMLKSLNT